ncbi:MAG: 3'(2'),5'-bisphosphate nucleotidase CysQ, partial [Deltaproteobacteria bacterium]|nr:3'(2'),5'-bisphosphate nucleotidase CysQ [Deltaproteobacteria bacterium]
LFGKDYQIREKGIGQPVTTADLEANERIHEIIMASFPNDGWLSEESQDDPRRLSRSRVWVIDPIDGTREFIQGVPQFAVSIALVIDGVPAVGVVFNPAEEKCFAAVRGVGAKLNDSIIRVSSRRDPDGARLLVSRAERPRRFQPFIDRYEMEPIGSIAFRLGLVAGGKGDGTITLHSVSEWDICAGVLLVEEAGGVVVDGSGRHPNFNKANPTFRGLVASNESLVEGIREILVHQLR